MSKTAMHTVTAPQGFLAAGVKAGIKSYGEKDLSLIVSTAPAVAAGVLTRNELAAPPVHLMREQLRRGTARAIIANSGNANCCTGKAGLQDAKRMGAETAKLLGVDARDVLVASTGFIGRRLPMPKLLGALPGLVERLDRSGSADAALGIMTTDTVPKATTRSIRIGSRTILLGGIAKGSGMLQPNMATMLAFLTTDAPLSRQAARRALCLACDATFNRVTVDGDTSTNDAVVLLANGLAGGAVIHSGTPAFDRFLAALRSMTEELAKMIARDGEGAQHLIEVIVEGARSPAEAERVARRLANSPLVKTMVAGGDPNWGRLAAAVGSSDVKVREPRVVIRCEPAVGHGGVTVFRGGRVLKTDVSVGRRLLAQDTVRFRVRLGMGKASCTIWTCDLTEEYVRINAGYPT